MRFLFKVSSIFLLSFLAIFTINSQALAANYQDGEFQATVTALQAGSNEPSVADDYIENEATLHVEDDVVLLKVIVPKDDSFSLFEMYKKGFDEIKDEDDDNFYYSFTIEEADIESGIIDVVSSYEVPAMNFIHEDVGFQLQIEGLADIPEAVDEATPSITTNVLGLNDTEDALQIAIEGEGYGDVPLLPGQTVPGAYFAMIEKDSDLDDVDADLAISLEVGLGGTLSGVLEVPLEELTEDYAYEVISWPNRSFPSDVNMLARADVSIDWGMVFPDEGPEDIVLENGFYTIDAAYLRVDNDNPSSMGGYIEDQVFLTVTDSGIEAIFTINDHETVTKLEVTNLSSTKQVVDGENRYESFQLNELASILDAYVEYQAPYQGGIHHGSAAFRIAFDASTIAEADEADKPGETLVDEDEDPIEDDPVDEEEPSDEDDETTNEDEVITYNIIAKALKIDSDEPSGAASFINENATVQIIDGKYHLTITIPKSDMFSFTGMQIDGASETRTEDDNNIYYTFVLDELSEILFAHTQYEVPSMNINHDVDFRFLLEGIDEIPGIEVEENTDEDLDDPDEAVDLVTTDDGSNDKSTEKPVFGSSNDANEESDVSVTVSDQDNPQTSELSNVWGYSLILLISLSLLTYLVRRRLA